MSGGRGCRRRCGSRGFHSGRGRGRLWSGRSTSQPTAMTAPLRLLSLARNHSLPCRRLILSHYIAPSSSPRSFFRRSFVSTQPHRAAPAPAPTPATPAVLRRSPTVEDIQTAELDIETLAQGDAQLALTERAAQVCRNFLVLGGCKQFDIWCMCSNSIEYLRKKRTQVPP
jgi:hypothetical protein